MMPEDGVWDVKAERDMIESDLLWLRSPPPRMVVGEMVCTHGIHLVLMSQFDLARRCFEFALPHLLKEVKQKEIPGKLIPASPAETAELKEQLAKGGEPDASVAAGTVQLGFECNAQSEWWACIAVCRWFMDGKDDPKSLRAGADCMRRHLLKYPKYATAGWHWDRVIRRFGLARDDAAVIQLLEQSGKLRPPAKPASVKSERAMAWVLAQHRAAGRWTTAEIDRAWHAFFTARAHYLLDIGGSLPGSVMWAKMAWWDGRRHDLDPFETYLRIYEYLPGVKRPPVRR